MLSKHSAIVALVGLNLFLLAAIILGSYSLPAAQAQSVGAGGNYIAVTCEADLSLDIIYIVDLPNRRLHYYMPARQLDGTLTYVGYHDLERDCRRD